jgi:hypothetical protein
MKTLALLLALIPSAVLAEEGIPVMPRIPTEAEKVEALRLGYILNGFSMKRSPSEGSIDVSQMANPTLLLSPAPGVVRTIPITPTKKKGER